MIRLCLLIALSLASAHATAGDSAACSLCQTLVSELKIVWKDPSTQDIAAMTKSLVCATIPIPDCETWMTNELKKIDAKIEALVPADTCASLGYCTTMTGYERVGDADQWCELCHDVATEIKKVANSPAAPTIGEELTAVICESLAIPFCKRVVGGFIEEWNEQLKAMDPEQACVTVHFCPALDVSKDHTKTVGDACSECTLVTGMVINALSQESTRKDVTMVVQAVCEMLPGPAAKACETTLEEYVDYIAEMKPGELCNVFGSCH